MSWEKLRGWPSGTSSCQRDQPPKCQRRLVAQDGFQGPPTKAPTTYRFGGNLVRTTFTVKRACVQDTLTKSHVDPHPPCSPSQRSWSVAPSELLLLCDRRDQETRPQITAWDLEKKKKEQRPDCRTFASMATHRNIKTLCGPKLHPPANQQLRMAS